MKHQHILLVLFLCLTLPLIAQEVQITKNEAVNLVLNEILADKIGKVDVFISKNPVSSNKDFQLHRKTLRCPYSSNWVIFIDDHVFANWDHPCRYVFIDTENKNYMIVNEKIFPANMETFEKISGVNLPLRKSTAPAPKMRKGASVQTVTPNPHYWAVVINGGVNDYNNHIRYWNDISSIYCTLTQVYGYMPQHIFVHSADGSAQHNHGSLDLDDDSYADIDSAASLSSITNTFKMLKDSVGTDDQLFVFTTDHGGRDGSGSFIYLWGNDIMRPSDLKPMFDSIKTSEIIAIMEQCYSGGFVTDATNITGSHRDVQTACNANQYSWAEVWITYGQYDEFVFYWTAAARGYYPDINSGEPWSTGAATGEFPFENYFGSHPGDYDPDTNGDGIVQMQEAFSYANDLDTWSEEGFYEPYYQGENEEPTPDHDVGVYEDLLSLSGISGTISYTQTIGGSFLVSGDLSVDAGVTLSINSASRFYFGSGVSLTSNGELDVNGTSGSHVTFTSISGTDPDTWGPILLSGTGANGSSISYADISNGTKLQMNNVASSSIQNCTISNTVDGIFAYNSVSTITDNSLSNQRDHGIVVYNSSVECTGNIVTKSDHSGAGMLYTAGGYSMSGRQNDIYGYNWGIGSSYGAYVRFPNSSEKNNRVQNCLYGLYVYQQGTLYIPGSTYGRNSIKNNTYYNAYVFDYGSMYASYNYWGWPVPTNKFYCQNGSYLDWSTPLDVDPWREEARTTSEPSLLALGHSGSAQRSFALLSVAENDILTQVRELRDAGRKQEAFDLLKSLFDNDKVTTAAISELYMMYEEPFTQEIEAIFSSISVDSAPLAQYYRGLLLSRSGEPRKAIAVFDQLAGTSLEFAGRLGQFYVNLYDINDAQSAENILESFGTKNGDDVQIALARNALNIFNGKSGEGESPKLPDGNITSTTKFGLMPNYPNPFNPATTISFTIQVSGLTSLKIYDVLGREIATLVDEYIAAGVMHNRTFDASRLPSGVYYYALKSSGRQEVRKMLYLK